MTTRTTTRAAIAIAKLVIPFLLFGLYVLAAYIVLPQDQFRLLFTAMVGYFFPPLGKESMIPFAVSGGVNWIVASLSVAYVDILIALFLL